MHSLKVGMDADGAQNKRVDPGDYLFPPENSGKKEVNNLGEYAGRHQTKSALSATFLIGANPKCTRER